MLAITLAALAAAAQAIAPAPKLTAQQALDAADARADAKDWAGALAGYEAAETVARSPRTLAILRIRQGEVLRQLDRAEEARARLQRGLAGLPATDAAVAPVRLSGLLALANLDELAFDFAQARASFRAALPLATTLDERLVALSGAARAGMFVDPAAAVADSDRALGLAEGRKDYAGYLTLRGRALLNAGRAAEAKTALLQATTELGGLTMKLDRADQVARSDAAIAALRARDGDTARKYLAYTGAARSKDGLLPRALDMDTPACGVADSVDEPRPDDVVVVEIGVADDGSVSHVAPVFASRPGAMIGQFMRAASGWSWDAEAVKAVRPFFRSAVRLELRCSKVVDRLEPRDLLKPAMLAWFEERGLAAAPKLPNGAIPAAGVLRAELARREAVGGAALLPILAELATAPAIDFGEQIELTARGATVAETAGAPPAVRAWFASLGVDSATYKRWSDDKLRPGGARRLLAGETAGRMLALARSPGISDSAEAVAAVRLLAADWARQAGDHRRAAEMLGAVADDLRLGARHQAKVGALVRLASVEAARKDMAAAQAAFTRSGLEEAQCALVDAKPAMTRIGLASADYPGEAIRWGFEGWTYQEFDIAANGTTRNVRTIAAFPPFVFGETSVAGVTKTRFEQSYRPQGALGCGGQRLSISYRMPG